MSASRCVAFFGLRFEAEPNEIEELEARSDARIVAARKVGLKFLWSNFGVPDERYLLFVGERLAILGPENDPEAVVSTQELERVIESTTHKLQEAGLVGQPSLYLQWDGDA